MSKADDALLDRAKRCFKLAQEAESSQRQREVEDLQFQVPELQWDDADKASRKGGSVNGVDAPPRPWLAISKLDQPIQLILNQARQARLGVNIHPVSEDSDKEGAEVRQGLYRRIERDSNANLARLWALERAVKAGRGAYRVHVKWDEDAPMNAEDPAAWDQEIVIERILHQENVYFDPGANEADFSDGNWAFVAVWMSLEDFKKEFPDADAADIDSGNESEWESLSQAAPGWVREEDNGNKAFLVCEYWYKDTETETIQLGGRERTREIQRVLMAKLCGTQVLSRQEWPGRYIPIIPVVGRELVPFNGERMWFGMIRPARHAQKFYNYAATTLVERMALEPKAPWVMAEGQDEGFLEEWKQSNTRNIPVLHYMPKTFGDGTPAAPPQRAQIDGTGMNLAAMAMQQGDIMMQTATAVHDPSLGRESSRDKSGKAILALQQQSDAGTGNFLSSMADVSMPLEARIILDLMPQIYDRPGRVTTILKGEDDKESSPVMLNAPFVMGRDGRPQAAQPQMPGMPPQQNQKHYDLSKGKYSISVDIGKSFQTRLQQGSEDLGQLLQAWPEGMMVIGDLYMGFRDFPGAQAVAERLKKLIKRQSPDLIEEDNPQSPEALQAELAAIKMQAQEMQQQLQEAVKEIETRKAQQEATILKTQMDTESREKIANLNNEVKMAIEAMKAQKEGPLPEQVHESGEANKDRAHEVALEAMKLQRAERQEREARENDGFENEMGRQHESGQSDAERQHASTEAQRGRAHESQEGREGRAHEAEQAAQAAKQKAKEPKK